MGVERKPVVVVGLARSGVKAAELLARGGAAVVATDRKPARELTEEALSLADVGVRLAHGKLKNVRQKSADAFKIQEARQFEPAASLDPQKEAVLSWSFQTDLNCPITDVAGSLFFLYGRGN